MPLRDNRYGYLDGLRGWAALSVVLYHAIIALDHALVTGQAAESRGGWDVWISGTPFFPFVPGGSLAVCVFFALSGFVLTHAYLRSRQTWLALATRRYVRLGIPMLAGCLLSWALLRAGLMSSHQASLITHSSWLGEQFQQEPTFWGALIEPVQTLFGSPVSGTKSYDSSLWTMHSEAVGSLGLITLFVLLRRIRMNFGRTGGYALCLLGVLSIGSFFSLFVFGAALRLFKSAKILVLVSSNRSIVAFFLLMALFLGTIPYARPHWWIYGYLTAISGRVISGSLFQGHSPVSFWQGVSAMLLLLAVISSRSIQVLLSTSVSRFLGRISLPIYIFHVPLLMVIECNAILLFERLGIDPVVGGLFSLGLFSAAAVAVATVLTPPIEGGAIALSSWIGRWVNTYTHWLDAQIGTITRRIIGQFPSWLPTWRPHNAATKQRYINDLNRE